MKKSYIFFVIMVVAIGAAGLILRESPNKSELDSNKTNTVTAEQQETTDDEMANTETSATLAQAGTYIDYDAELVSKTKGKRLLFFHASWCVQCRALEKSILDGNIPEGVTIFKVDYDSNQTLRQQYGVTIQTTLVLLDDAGNEVKKYVAYEEPTLESVLTNAL